MTKDMLIRGWKDSSFRATLTPEQSAALPATPAGLSAVELKESSWRRRESNLPPGTPSGAHERR